MDRFSKRKQDVLSKEDKSSKGSWDERIIDLCEKINSCENYYTTSSCSGRIIIMKDIEKKGPNLFLFISHDHISFEDINNFIRNTSEKNVKFKFEPFILHIACRDLESAKSFLKLSKKCGIKNSGVISLGKNIVVEIKGSQKLEFPLIRKGSILVSPAFLMEIVNESNKYLKQSWELIEKLKKLLS